MAKHNMALSPLHQQDSAPADYMNAAGADSSEDRNNYSSPQNTDDAQDIEGMVELAAWLQRIVAP